MHKHEGSLIVYPFPIQVQESVYFEARGAFIKKAVLMAGDTMLSVIEPKYETEDIEPPQIDIGFFGDKPFHAALAREWKVQILLYVSDGRIPSLSIVTTGKTITWKDEPSGIYYEKVTAGSNDGAVTRTLVYMKHTGGYKKENM